MTGLGQLAAIPVSSLKAAGRPLPRSRGDRGPVRTRADALADMGITTVLDLLTHYPRRYLDRTTQTPIGQLAEGEDATVVGLIKRIQSRRPRSGGRPMVTIDLFDGSSYLTMTFFNQPWRAQQLQEGLEVAASGKVTRYQGRRQMANPQVEVIEGDYEGRIIPIYPQSDKAGIGSMDIAACVAEALRRAGPLVEPLPAWVLSEQKLMGRHDALHATHQPDSVQVKEMGRRRLGFDELLRLQLVLVMRKRALERESLGLAHPPGSALVTRFRDDLPFPLTGAQQRAIGEIERDLARTIPMHRLLQGDVGSGKTIVAVWTLLTAIAGGYQGALMAPTEVLAEQHYLSISRMLAGLTVPDDGSGLFPERPLGVQLLTNRTTGAERRRLLEELAGGRLDLVIGTHALLTEAVRFHRLGAVVIDEQHRFGVDQRAALREKADGHVPDVLVMTATPIPRTAAMTVYGDLDTTVLDEMPPGRTPITTVWARTELEAFAAWQAVRDQVAAGRQAYVVCPLVEESEKIAATSATEEFERLSAEVFPDLRLGLLHGQLPAAEREAVMAEYRAGRLDVLVATTVIEVGVDVPNATVMVIEDADRFGIAQLHQLRGRVGRGGGASWCYLLGAGLTPDGEQRLEAMVRTTDGFELAEVDLDLRGEGTILGSRQKGVNDLKLASLRRHRKVVVKAREVAFALIDADPTLAASPDLAEELALLVDDEDRQYLFRS